ncbi:MAG: 16S rRNA (cytosine(967)-C(5))-methyltransferase RsmB [Oxalobacter sp.]|nr:16S rRNA (cytosine(967)-C(5))-methyltransferase RsmB [Oxalobacter sp.]
MAKQRTSLFSGQAPAMDSLAFRLAGAADAVRQVSAGRSLPDALQATFTALNVDAASRGAIQDIAYNAMRKLGSARFLIGKLTKYPPAPEMLQHLLACAFALLVRHDNLPLRYEPFTTVNQAVQAASAIRGTAKAKGLVNAVLRHFLREQDQFEQMVNQDEVAQWNYPAWWIARVRKHYPNQWQSILTVGNQPPPLTLRVNQRRTTPEGYLENLHKKGLKADIIGPSAIRLSRPLPVNQIPGFMEGLVSVQDYAAQMAAPLLDLKDGMRVLDACAAPGGKSAHMLELADIRLTALDCEKKRLKMIHENLHRLGLSAEVRHGDATLSDWWDGTLFDCILADVPCSASGIIRRHPDIRWLRQPEDSHNLATLSAAILENLWGKLRKGGKLLIATCSIWPEESKEQADFFAFRADAKRLDAFGQLLPTFDGLNDHDGLFYGLFQKT